ncbi:VOC family protein [Sphingomonas solaris]|uniref:Lactoylglutathione lyase n=1 Tax=Alterirhizorhabdus solaris TaxID=2529389 RepID=A0A558QS01_9SPHN|nr:VOC family protein [Sphingomonas solaris]TVV69899.1 lactoylglutathione lyase [Sphingomonas solaris]
MPRMIFINLPVADVAASTAFYEAIGFEKNPRFSDGQASSMVWSDAIYVMLLAKPFFATFTQKTIVDATTSSTGHYALSFDSRAEVDAITQAAIEAGGRELHEPQDMGFMYSRAFEDLDGHGFGPFWMDPAAVEGGPPDDA